MGTKPNAYLARQDAIKEQIFDFGCKITTQKVFDLMCIILHNPRIMGTHAVTGERMRIIHDELCEAEKFYRKAWLNTQESDYYQDKLDDALREVFDEIVPFRDRYPLCKEWDYNKPLKGRDAR